MFKFIDNAADVAKHAWSVKMSLLIALLSSITMSMPLWDPTASWFSIANIIAMGTFFSGLGAAFLRLVDQGLSKKKTEEDEDGQIPLGI